MVAMSMLVMMRVCVGVCARMMMLPFKVIMVLVRMVVRERVVMPRVRMRIVRVRRVRSVIAWRVRMGVM